MKLHQGVAPPTTRGATAGTNAKPHPSRLTGLFGGGDVGRRERQRGRSPELRRNPLYLFACHLESWHRGKLESYQELVAALDDGDEDIRIVAEKLLRRSSLRPPHRKPNSNDEQW